MMEKIIEAVKKYPILYDVSHDDYKNIPKKDKVWRQVGQEIGENGDEVKKKWRNLRDTYSKFIKSNRNKTKKWIWAEHMKMFRPYINASKTISNVNDIYSEECTTIDPAENVKTEIYETDNFGENSDDPLSDMIHLQSSVTTAPENRKRKYESSTSLQDTVPYFESKPEIEYDPIDKLFLAYASTVKTFSARRQIEVKMKIAQVIMEQELLHLDESTSNSYQY